MKVKSTKKRIVNLSLIVEGFERACEGETIYFDTKENRLISFNETESCYSNQVDKINRAYVRYLDISIPEDMELYDVMEEFVEGIEDEFMKEELSKSFRNYNSYKKFDDMISQLGLDEQCYQFRTKEIIMHAESWLSLKDIDYINDVME